MSSFHTTALQEHSQEATQLSQNPQAQKLIDEIIASIENLGIQDTPKLLKAQYEAIARGLAAANENRAPIALVA